MAFSTDGCNGTVATLWHTQRRRMGQRVRSYSARRQHSIGPYHTLTHDGHASSPAGRGRGPYRHSASDRARVSCDDYAVGGLDIFFRPVALATSGQRCERVHSLPRRPPTAAPSRRTGRHCVATNTSDSPSAYAPPILGQCGERNTTGTRETTQESGA